VKALIVGQVGQLPPVQLMPVWFCFQPGTIARPRQVGAVCFGQHVPWPIWQLSGLLTTIASVTCPSVA
jgi:hypothetical protein